MSRSLAPFPDWPSLLTHLFERYGRVGQDRHAEVAQKLGVELADRVVNLCAHARQNIGALSEDKANRWLGFVQGILIAAGVLGVDEERDYTRPLFHAIKGVSPTHDVGNLDGSRT